MIPDRFDLIFKLSCHQSAMNCINLEEAAAWLWLPDEPLKTNMFNMNFVSLLAQACLVPHPGFIVAWLTDFEPPMAILIFRRFIHDSVIYARLWLPDGKRITLLKIIVSCAQIWAVSRAWLGSLAHKMVGNNAQYPLIRSFTSEVTLKDEFSQQYPATGVAHRLALALLHATLRPWSR